jgi:4-hydroxy-tetrahydrodipicolinate synthase
MKTRIFTGSGVAIVTPMNQDGSINWDVYAQMIEYQIENKTDAIIVCGTTGESPTLSDDEHLDSIKFVVKQVAKRVPVIAGTGSNDTQYAITLSMEAEKAGADGLLIVTPYYNKASQRGLVKHYTMIAENTSLPIILYNVPSRTGTNITPKTCFELSKIKNIVAVKEASGNISAVVQIKALCGDNLDVYSGNDDQIVPILSLGGVGVISVLSNIIPKETHDIVELYLDGKVQESCDLQLKLSDLIDAIFIDINPIPIKEAMNMMNFNVGECRMPLCSMSDNDKEVLRASMQRHKLV